MSTPTSILEQFRLDDRVAVITGASRGLGRAMALGMASAGARVALVGRDLTTLEPAAQEIERDLGVPAAPFQLDVARLEEIPSVVERIVARFGKIDIVVNNAGTNVRNESVEYAATDWDRVVDVNLKGTFFFTQTCARHMLPRKQGKVINIVSMTCYMGVPLTVAYTASKAGLLAMTRLLAVEWADHNIQVNGIAPGWFHTEMTENLKGTPRYQWVLNRTPAGRFGEPEELVGAAVFLASPAADFITGQVLAVDGGILAGSDWRKGR